MESVRRMWKVLYIPTAGIETDGARVLAICFSWTLSNGIQYENILVYNLELILFKRLSKNLFFVCYNPVYAYKTVFWRIKPIWCCFCQWWRCICALSWNATELAFDRILNNAIKNGLIYQNQCRKYTGNLTDGLHIIDNPIIPTLEYLSETTVQTRLMIKLADGKAVYAVWM